MKKIFLSVLVLICSVQVSFSQFFSDSILSAGDVFYKKHNYEKAGPLFALAADSADNKVSKASYYYYAANAYANAKDTANSFRCLESAIIKFGFNDLLALKDDSSFSLMHKDKRWNKLLHAIKPAYTVNPLETKISDIDVRNFWKADAMVQKDTAHAAAIYKKYYLDPGSNALQDYYAYKIVDMNSFVWIHINKPKFYNSIRESSLRAVKYKPQIISSFVAFKKIYPEALFADIHFVMGRLHSAGTSTGSGLIIGIDQRCKTSTTDISELSVWEKNNVSDLSTIPYTVAHELVHYEQGKMASDTTLLKEAVIEGMADFIGKLISGKTTIERLFVFAKGKEKAIWKDFKKEMYLSRAYNWIANSDQETADKPADLGYWVGYQICKAYYEEAKNKKQAIYDMLHIQDYKKFLEAGKLDEKMK